MTQILPWDQLGNLPEPEWLIDGILPHRQQTHLFGPAGIGKSLLALHMALSVCEGTPFAGHYPTKQAKVLWMDYENGPILMRDRLDDYGYPPDDLLWFDDKMAYWPFPDIEPLNTLSAANDILQEIATHQIDLVVIDSMGLAFQGDENSSDTYREFGRNLGSQLREAGIGLLMVDNTGKDTARGARGSSRKKDEADIQWGLTATSMDSYQLTLHKDRMGNCPKAVALEQHYTPYLTWIQPGTKHVSDGAAKLINQWKTEGYHPTSKRAARRDGYQGKERYLTEAVQWWKLNHPKDIREGTT